MGNSPYNGPQTPCSSSSSDDEAGSLIVPADSVSNVTALASNGRSGSVTEVHKTLNERLGAIAKFVRDGSSNLRWTCLLDKCKEEGSHRERFVAHLQKMHLRNSVAAQLCREYKTQKEAKTADKGKSSKRSSSRAGSAAASASSDLVPSASAKRSRESVPIDENWVLAKAS